MTDFTPPSGPPPPKVPEGWKAIWNDQYSEWFYVNIYTKKSQWEKPDSPVYPPGEAPDLPPPSYAPSSTTSAPTEKSSLGSNNPYVSGGAGPAHDISEDERLARQLQDEEDAMARTHLSHRGMAGTSDSFYQQPGTPQPGYGQYNAYPPQQGFGEQQVTSKGKSKGGLLGKLLGKAGGGSKPHHGYSQQAYGAPPGVPHGYGQHAPGQPGYGYPQQHYAQPGRRPGGGIGPGGAAALGVGGGLLGGMMLGSAIEGAADAGDGGDYGGDGGDFGGDGGDFGGGDFGGGGF
ncbi:hypothetical protein K469DRAFT_201198 [Zopfia rhizophila CBS 207.26]|uniref:WW domain-containing protein n=1 Tax=Zopfia rhizophila CBS 207.26 TaxID=1314779 RepID=A0A6A6DVS8_9PEZI|nr:hypothetical protein K469DRAFT_201198 [Zopfia rhizophila CBS 207.26]